jgi:zinc protease
VRKISFVFLLLLSSLFAFPFQKDTLENGMVLLTVEDHKLPILEIRVVIRAGSLFDPKGKEGLANLTIKSLFRGTKTRSASEIYEAIEAVGARIGEWTGYDYSQISVSLLNKDLDLILEIISDLLFNPSFPDTEIKKLKSEIIAGISRDEGEPDYLLSREFYQILFSPTPYAHPVEGMKETVARLTREDVLDFYHKYYLPNNIFLVVVGDFQREDLMAKIEDIFGRVPKGKLPEFSFPAINPLSGRKAKIITKEDVNQSYIMLGHLGIKEGEKDMIPARVLNFILGGGALTSRLGKEIREKRGLAYDVGSYFDRRLYSGAFVCEMQTEIKNTTEAIRIILNEINRIKNEGANLEELNRAKRFYTGNFPLTFDSYAEKASLLTWMEFYQIGDNYIGEFPKRIEELTLEKINETAKRYLDPDNLFLVIVGNISEKDLALEGFEIIK